MEPISIALSGATLGIMGLWVIRKIIKHVKKSSCMIGDGKNVLRVEYKHESPTNSENSNFKNYKDLPKPVIQAQRSETYPESKEDDRKHK